METVRFYPVDIGYKIESGKAVIHLFGRTTEGKQICVIDKKCEPYFMVLPKPGTDAESAILKTEVEGAKVIRIEKIEKNVLGIKKNMLKVYADLPKSVPKLKDSIKYLDEVDEVYEYDILFARRYLVDNHIIPMTLCEVKGTVVPHNTRVPVYSAEEITTVGETYEKPKCLAVDIETYNPDGKNIDAQQHPIVMMALYGEGLKKVLTYKNIATDADYVEVLDSESEMLERFSQIIKDYGPDMILGYHSDGFDLPYINTRAKKYKLGLDLGLDDSEMEINGTSNKKVSIMGIAHIDILPFIRRVLGRTLKTDSYKLDNVAEELLGEKKIEVDIDKLAKYWDTNDPMLGKFAEYNLKDAELTYRLAFKIMPQMIELVKLVGSPIFDVTRMAFSQLVEWFLIRMAQDYEEIVPNKPGYNQSTARMEERVQGAFVYEPVPGLYENIAVFDFLSLYPSIIISHNISLETVNCKCCESQEPAPVEGETIWFCKKKRGFLSQVLKDIIDRRIRVKELIREKGKDPMLSARSDGLKLMAVSYYGYLGFAPARWYNFSCQQSITAYGRSYINDVIQKAEKKGFKVVYGDTDSVFLQLTEHNGEKEALEFMDEINSKLPGMMELEFEGLFPAGIFVSAKGSEAGAKKRYALMNNRHELIVKGFEIVRRNWSSIGKDAQRKVLEILLGERDVEKAMKYVRDLASKLRSGGIALNELVISTQLTKPIKEYGSVGPHVAAAMLMEEQGKTVKSGTIVRYVITKGKGKIRDKVKLPSQTKPDEIDSEYYINNQILPAVEKIFEVFDISHDQLVNDTTQSSLSGFF